MSKHCLVKRTRHCSGQLPGILLEKSRFCLLRASIENVDTQEDEISGCRYCNSKLAYGIKKPQILSTVGHHHCLVGCFFEHEYRSSIYNVGESFEIYNGVPNNDWIDSIILYAMTG